MSQNPHSNGANNVTMLPGVPLDAITRRNIKAARTRRVNRRLKPLDDLDAEVRRVIERMDSAYTGDDPLHRNIGRVMLQGLTLRKDIVLARLDIIESERRLEALDIAEEWEKVKHALGIA
jgi:hypothetical protein